MRGLETEAAMQIVSVAGPALSWLKVGGGFHILLWGVLSSA